MAGRPEAARKACPIVETLKNPETTAPYEAKKPQVSKHNTDVSRVVYASPLFAFDVVVPLSILQSTDELFHGGRCCSGTIIR